MGRTLRIRKPSQDTRTNHHDKLGCQETFRTAKAGKPAVQDSQDRTAVIGKLVKYGEDKNTMTGTVTT